MQKKIITIYGDGLQIRDWLYVKDHVKAIDLIFHEGKTNESYNIGGDNELKNIQLAKLICDITDKKLANTNSSKKLIKHITDRKGHDRRYAIDNSKIKNNLGWKISGSFNSKINNTIDWYITNFKH